MYGLVNMPPNVWAALKEHADSRGASCSVLAGVIIEQVLTGKLVRANRQVLWSSASCPVGGCTGFAGRELSPCSRGAFVRRRRGSETAAPEPLPHCPSCLGVTPLAASSDSEQSTSVLYASVSDSAHFPALIKKEKV